MSVAAVEENAPRPVVAHPGARDLYRILLLRSNGSELLVAGEQPPFTLPCIEIPRWERVAINLNAAVKKRYGISAFCLFTPDLPVATSTRELHYQVMEAIDTGAAVSKGMVWLPLASFLDQSFADGQDFVATTIARRQMLESQNEKTLAPFAKPGWIDELFRWTEWEIGSYGLRLSGAFRQLNASSTFALLRMETNGPAVWFKAVGEPNLREFPITVALSNLLPLFVPTVIATRPTWHGWLTTGFPGSTLDELPEASAWARAAQTLAELQIASVEKTEQLLEAGCRDLRANSLLGLAGPFIEQMAELMKQQQPLSPPALNEKELYSIVTGIEQALCDWEKLRIPDALGHLDLNPGNILSSTDHCIFIDWVEAYIGPPFLTFEYLRSHLGRLQRGDIVRNADVVGGYTKAWTPVATSQAVGKALNLSPFLAVFAYAAATQGWRDPALLAQSGIAAYYRSLTRRMYVEMQRLQSRRHP